MTSVALCGIKLGEGATVRSEAQSTEQSLARITHLYASLRTIAMADTIDYDAAMGIAAQLRTLAFAIGDPITADKAGLARAQLRRLRRHERKYAEPRTRQLITALEDTRQGLRVATTPLS